MASIPLEADFTLTFRQQCENESLRVHPRTQEHNTAS